MSSLGSNGNFLFQGSENPRPRRVSKSKPKNHINGTESKDTSYFERRKRNNIAAKKSRDARKLRDEHMTQRVADLEIENNILKHQVAWLREEFQLLQLYIYQNKQHHQHLQQHQFQITPTPFQQDQLSTQENGHSQAYPSTGQLAASMLSMNTNVDPTLAGLLAYQLQLLNQSPFYMEPEGLLNLLTPTASSTSSSSQNWT